MASKAATPDEYVAELAPDRAAVVSAVRDLVNRNLPPGYVEIMDYGMITWAVPLEVYPDTYNGHPTSYVALAAQKNYTSLYLMNLYTAAGRMDEDEFRSRWNGGRALDMGKSCVRFTAVEDLDLDLLAEVVGSVALDDYVAAVRASRTTK